MGVKKTIIALYSSFRKIVIKTILRSQMVEAVHLLTILKLRGKVIKNFKLNWDYKQMIKNV